MTTPIGGWDGDAIRPGCAWWSRLDDRYLIEVQYGAHVALPRGDGLSEEMGLLCIFDRENDLALIHSEPTAIIEGARFGPDVRDVQRWEAACERVVDAQ